MQQRHDPQQGSRVVVIGAGLSGLQAGLWLRQAGHRVVVLEARPRVGGRTCTLRPAAAGGRPVDIGGAIVGLNHRRCRTLLAHYGLALEPFSAAPLRPFWHGRPLTPAQRAALGESHAGLHRQLTALAASVDAAAPWRSPDAAALDQQSMEDWVGSQGPSSAEVREALLSRFFGLNGVPPARQSLLGQLAMIKGGGLDAFWRDSHTHVCHAGAQALSLCMARDLQQQGGSCELATPVVRLVRRAAGWQVVGRQSREGATKERHWEADYVVLSAPGSTWDAIHISPPLPFAERPQMGQVLKAIQYFDPPLRRPEPIAVDVDPRAARRFGWYSGNAAAGYHARTLFITPDYLDRQQLGALATADGPAELFDWRADPFARGAYPFPAPGELTRIGAALAGLHDGLAFCGDFSPAYVGYMEGALQSGVAAAQRVDAAWRGAAPSD